MYVQRFSVVAHCSTFTSANTKWSCQTNSLLFLVILKSENDSRDSEDPYHLSTTVDGNSLVGATRVRGPTTGDHFNW